LAGGAYHLAGGGPCIAIDVGPSSPLAGNSAPNAASRLCRVESRHLLVRVKLWGRPAGRQARLLRQWPLRMGRVRRNIRGLAILWMISGILRLMGIGWMMIFGRMLSRTCRAGWDRAAGRFSGGAWTAFFRGNFFRGHRSGALRRAAPGSSVGAFRARAVGAVPRASFGIPGATAFSVRHGAGIYTLWVLLPESSGHEYERPGAAGRTSPLRVGFFLSLSVGCAPRVPAL